MKIGSDIPDRIPKNFKNLNSTKNKSFNRKIQESSQNLNQTLGSRISSNRSIGDALTLARISQSLIQKAIIISSRLQNLASEAITTGKVDTEEVDLAVNEINSSISTYGNEIATPVTTITDSSPNIEPLPEFRSDMENLKDEAVKIQNNEKPDIETIDAITENLITKSKQIGDTTNIIFREAAATDIKPNNYSDVENVVINTTELINGSGTEALISQGNIRPDIVEKVL